ncbi:uncharacterized protein LOC127260714 [Andrographis paniculata]|uniref:uncharacterized protein LOC127260714 n=1 Tax=Andrographis paniculata TaxID=175694 RepID=UPI0021E727BC|nr:uncharacterized protein LOC127260714 [Andrographis paniculata]
MNGKAEVVLKEVQGWGSTLHGGLAFLGHDESEGSLNKGNFLELLHLVLVHNSDYQKVVLKNAPGNCQLIGPSIQKDIINACAKETTKAIIEELDGISLNQELGLSRPGDTRWGSHFKTILIFVAHLMLSIFGITNELNLALKNMLLWGGEAELMVFEYSLGNFITHIRCDERFWDLKDLNELSMKLVETKKNETHSRVYLLLKLVLLLPLATTTVERSFSAMTIIKKKLRNNMGDQLLNDYLVTFLERR